MISVEYCNLMACYKQWMNRRLYALCATLPEAERKRDRGAFFGSIHATLDHLVYGDLAFLSRFTGEPPEAPQLGVELYTEFEALSAARAALDRRIIDWAAGLGADWLAGALSFTSNVDGRRRTLARWVLVSHMFNHQTHHRGQITTLLSQSGRDIGSTDLPFMPGATH